MATITVATLNIFNKSGRWGERLPLLIEQFMELQPDVIGLQEVDLTIDEGMHLQRLINRRRVDGAPRWWIYHMGRPGRAAAQQSLATMSRLPCEAHEGLDFLSFEGVAQRLRFRLPDGGALEFYNTHLYWPPEGVQERLAQAEKLVAWTDTWQGADATVVSGDFNAYPGEPVLDLMKGRFASAHESVHGTEPEKTWPTPVNTFDPSPHGCLDYIFVRGAQIEDARVVFDKPHALDADLYPSDHLGVMARLTT
jgi:endonuclease/exonuclease/phosphatase family metal-dependent hydrolase